MYNSQCLFCHTNIAKCHTLLTKDYCLTTSSSSHPGRFLCSGFLECLHDWHPKNGWWGDYHPGGDSSLVSLFSFKNINVYNPLPPLDFKYNLSWAGGGGVGYFWNCTFWPLIGHSTHLCTIHKILYQVKLNKLSNSYLVMQIAITFISDNILDCNVHEDSIIQLMTIYILATWSSYLTMM